MKLMYFALNPVGAGEVVIALNLVDQLAPAGITGHFVVTPSSETMIKESGLPYTVVDQAMGPAVRDVIDHAVREARPDALVLADYFTYWARLDKQHGIDPWFIEEYGLPILPIDTWEWESTSFRIDLTSDVAPPVSRKILEMPAHLRPVPLGRPDAGDSRYGLPYRLATPTDRVSDATRREVFDSLGLGAGDRLLLVPSSAWQQHPVGHFGELFRKVAQQVPELLAHYLRQLPESTHFVLVGDVAPPMHALPAGRTHVLPPCPPARYSNLLGSADAVLTLSHPAMTMVRAVLADVPGMVLTNGFGVNGGADVDRVDAAVGGLTPAVRDWLTGIGRLYPFRMWPMSFHTFMAPLLADNPYLDAVSTVELLDERAVVSGLSDLLSDGPTRERAAAGRAAYRRAVDALPDTREVFATAAARSGLRV
ncbi:hypothetical protein GCM10009558_094090 [Virgisporangium aurantiacum]